MGKILAVIGKNFGDEGKGHAVDRFTEGLGRRALVVRHNGGGQAGHTVERAGRRVVFHQYGSGTLNGCPTLLAETFLPDLVKLRQERLALGTRERVYMDPKCRLTAVYDVAVNSWAETARGAARHGSCGMGIFEAVQRSLHEDLCLTAQRLCAMSHRELTLWLEELRLRYVPRRLEELEIPFPKEGVWAELLTSPYVSANAAELMLEAKDSFRLCPDPAELAGEAERLVFEGAQGLLLDWDRREYYPHITASHTGSTNVAALLDRWALTDPVELCYVSRTYVTRHGAGALPWECDSEAIGPGIRDDTNVFNPWQRSFRYGLHPDPEGFFAPVRQDLEHTRDRERTVSLYLTHLNEVKISSLPRNDFIKPTEKEITFRPRTDLLSLSVVIRVWA